MAKGKSTRGPCGGAGPLAGNGLSQYSRKNRGNVHGQEREVRFPFMVNAHLNFAATELEGQAGVVHVGKTKTVLATKVERLENGEIVAKVVNSAIEQVNYFTMRVEEWVARGYGRVVCTQKGRPLPRRKLQNSNYVGQESRKHDGLVQPAYVGLNHVFIVEALGRGSGWRITAYWFIKGTKSATEIKLGDEQFFLTMPEELKRRFYITSGSDHVPTQQELEETIRTQIESEFKEKEEREAWEPMVTAMALAYRKACGDQTAYMLDREDETEEADEPAKEPEPEAPAMQATGTDDEVIELTDPVTVDPNDTAGAQALEQKPDRHAGKKPKAKSKGKK